MNEKHHFLPLYFVEISKGSNFSANYSHDVRLVKRISVEFHRRAYRRMLQAHIISINALSANRQQMIDIPPFLLRLTAARFTNSFTCSWIYLLFCYDLQFEGLYDILGQGWIYLLFCYDLQFKVGRHVQVGVGYTSFFVMTYNVEVRTVGSAPVGYTSFFVMTYNVLFVIY